MLSSLAFLSLAFYSSYFSAFAKTPNVFHTESPTPQTIEQVVIQRDTVERVVRDTVMQYRTRVEILKVRDTVYLRRDVPIASTPTPEPEDEQAVSKSLSTGIDWGELTVRGVGELGGE